MKRRISFLLIIVLLVTPNINFALDISEEMSVTEINFVRQYNGLILEGARLELIGKGLSSQDVSIYLTGEGFLTVGSQVGTIGNENQGYINIELDNTQTSLFEGRINILGEIIQLDLSGSSEITNINQSSINVDPEEVAADQLVLEGENLEQTVNDPNVTAVIRPDGNSFNDVGLESISDEILIFDKFDPKVVRGSKTITITKTTYEGDETLDETDDLTKKITNEYINLFRVISDLPMDITMYPNTGGKGDTINIIGDAFEPDKQYKVYLLEDKNDFVYDDYEEALFQSLEIDIDGTPTDRLSVGVPDNKNISTGEYYIKVVEINQTGDSGIVASKFVENNQGNEAIFTLIDSNFRPTIEEVDPEKGPDIGSNIEITGENILSLKLPELTVTDGPTYVDEGNDSKIRDLIINYVGTYDGEPATVSRKISILIGDKVIFRKDTDNNFIFAEGDSYDTLALRTSGTNDAETDSFKDVIMSIDTVVTANGTDYTFNQEVRLEDGFEYLPSSTKPTVNNVVPGKIEVNQFGSIYGLTEDIQFSITGEDFLVEKLVVDGQTITRYPTILFKKDRTSTQVDQFQLGFFPQGRDVGGIAYNIVYKDENGVENGIAEPLDMMVLDENNQIVDGSNNNQVGTKILFTIPKEVRIPDLQASHVQVTNITYGTEDYGLNDTKFGAIEFMDTIDDPNIESVNPSVVTTEGNVPVEIIGSNFQEDVQVILDGEILENVTRDIDATGEKFVLAFTAPKNRAGQTQLQVLNPSSGGIDTWIFEYITTFDKDPIVDAFSPKKGSMNTLVTITGDNFLKADQTARNTTGSSAYALIGSRVFLDGKDINDYNIEDGQIIFEPYKNIPDKEPLIISVQGKATYSSFFNNTYVLNGNNSPVTLANGESNNPLLLDNGAYYLIRSDNNQLKAYDASNDLIGQVAVGPDSISIENGPTFEVVMNNKILRKNVNASNQIIAELSDYAESVLLIDKNSEQYIITKNLDRSIVLSNGRDKRYEITYDSEEGVFEAVDGDANHYTVLVENSSLSLQDADGNEVNNFTFSSPYEKEVLSPTASVIVGDRVRVITKNKIEFKVPFLTTGLGYKDLFVVNPDTKKSGFQGDNGFFYIEQVQTNPIISMIDPNKGSIIGGYDIIVQGNNFEEDTRVFIDGVESASVELLDVDGKMLKVTVPEYGRDLNEEYNISRLSVPVVVLNNDGANYYVENGFTYVIPPSEAPEIEQVILTEGSSIGGDIVEIYGQRFKFAEPYKEIDGRPGYNASEDILEDLFLNGVLDNLLEDPVEEINEGIQLLELSLVDKSAETIDAINAFDYSSDLTNYINNFPDNSLDILEDMIHAIENASVDSFVSTVTESEVSTMKSAANFLNKIPFRDSFLKDFFGHYYESPILPKVYFGGSEGQVVDYENGYLKVITPPHPEGRVNLYVINNDYGVSNKVGYNYLKSTPRIDTINPNIGNRRGQETKDIRGAGLQPSLLRGYINNIASGPTEIDQDLVNALIRFGNINNSKQINGRKATITLDGGLTVNYDGDKDTIEMIIQEDNEMYRRTFEDYSDTEVFMPIEMLRKEENGDFLYYRPFDYEGEESAGYSDTRFEFIKVFIENRRLFVERGYSPEVTYNNSNHVQVKTPSYYTTDTVDITYINPDGGTGTKQFTYTNPASRPKILQVQPRELKFDGSSWLVFGTIQGIKQLEIIGEDFRDGVSITINGKDAPVIDFGSKKMSDGVTYDTVIVQVPQGTEVDVGQEYPIIVTNKDLGIANSALNENLMTPIEDTSLDNNGDINGDGVIDDEDKLQYYFVYQKPLSGPTIGEVIPNQTSVYGGNEIRIVGEDFREDAYVIIGSAGGVPIKDVDVDPRGQYIIFTTPRGLTLGPKDVQIINSDYGIDIIEDGLEIISAPVTEEVLTEDGRDPKERVSIEGGEKIIIEGESFQEGANVYFGGLWQPQDDEGLQGPRGLYRNDQTYVVENGVAAQNVEYIDSETLLVTTPALQDEDEYSIVVINADGGITDDDLTIEGREPIPSDPVGLEAELVDDRYIKIYDYYSENVDYYEVYAVIEEDHSIRALIRNNYRDFNYLDTTEIEPYKITDLPGIEDMDDDESLYIVLKAVNKYGPSNWSNIVELDYERDDLEDIEKFGNPDTDGDLGVPEGESHEIIKDEEKLTVNVAPGNYGSVVVDLSDQPNKDNRVINIPSEKVRSDYHYISVNFGDAYLQFSPQSLNTDTFNQFFYRYGEDSYVTVENKVLADDYSALMRSYLPRGRKAISPVQEVSARVRNNTTEEVLDQYNSPLDFGLYYNSDYLRAGQNIGIYRFDESNNTWKAVETSENETLKILTTKVLENGYYVILKY